VSDDVVHEDWDGTDVSIGEVLDRLAAQRRPGGGRPVALTGVLNLIGYAPRPAELPRMAALVDGLGGGRPSRAVLIAGGDGPGGIDATVSTSCLLGGDHEGVAVETVTLTLRGEAREGAASAVVPLLRPDLPTVLWWPGPPDAAGDGPLERLAPVVDRVVTESGRAGDAGVAALARWAPGSAAHVTDLAWAHITPWRQLIAQMIDGEPLGVLRAAPASAALAHGGDAPDAATLLLAGWLADVVGPGLAVAIEPGPAGAPPGPWSVDLRVPGSARRLAVERVPACSAAAVRVTEADGTERRRVLPLPHSDRAHLLAGELELQRRDRPFERALAAAARVAR
jgi:hypothetical protein